MSDVTVMGIDEMESIFGGAMRRTRAALGVTSFGMQIFDLPPNYEDYPEHDETSSGQEEVYIPLRGSATLIAGGKKHALEPGTMARVGCGVKRRLLPGPQGLRYLAIGGVPGQAYAPAEWTELGAPEPSMDG